MLRRRFLFLGVVFSSVVFHAAAAQETLVVDAWGGNWQEGLERTVVKAFTEQTGMAVEFRTGNTTDRLTKAKVAGLPPEVDVTLTTTHMGPLYVEAGLLEKLDMSRIPNAKDLFPQAIRSPYHLGLYSYVYTPVFHKDFLPEGFRIESWEDLWSPKLKETIALPDFDPSHIITVAAILSGADAATWETGIPKLKALKPNIKALFGSDANSQELMASGETPVQVMLSINAHHRMEQGFPLQIEIPKEGAVVGIDTISINKGTSKLDAAYTFVNLALDPTVQKELAEFYKAGPTNKKAKLSPEVASLPGVMTTPDQWESEAILIDDKVRSSKMNEWIVWFTENMSR